MPGQMVLSWVYPNLTKFFYKNIFKNIIDQDSVKGALKKNM